MIRLQLAAASLLLLLAVADAAAAATQHELVPTLTADKAKEYIDAMKQLSEWLGKGFENIKVLSNGLPGFLGAVSKAIGIINVLFGLPSSQSQQLKAYFEQVNTNFERVFIQMDEVKRLISWESTRGKYAEDEKNIIALQLYYKRYISDPDNADYRRDFIDQYTFRQGAATNLYLGIVTEGQVLLDNLAQAAKQFTQNNRRLTTDFLVGLLKLIIQGSQMDILYYKLTDRNNQLREAQWQKKMDTLLKKMDSVENQLLAGWRDQASRDIDEVMRVSGGQDASQLRWTLYNKLKPKFYWKKWCVIASKPSNGANYLVRNNGNSWKKSGKQTTVQISASNPRTLNMDAVKHAIGHTKKQAYSVNIVSNMNSYFRTGLSQQGQSSYNYTYVIRALCANCRLYAAGESGQYHSQHFVSFWYNGLPVALDGNIAAC